MSASKARAVPPSQGLLHLWAQLNQIILAARPGRPPPQWGPKLERVVITAKTAPATALGEITGTLPVTKITSLEGRSFSGYWEP